MLLLAPCLSFMFYKGNAIFWKPLCATPKKNMVQVRSNDECRVYTLRDESSNYNVGVPVRILLDRMLLRTSLSVVSAIAISSCVAGSESV